MAKLRIELFGDFRVVAGDRAIPGEVWRRRKTAATVKLLALAPRHRLHRDQLMDALWPELGPAAAAANLRKAVHYARHAAGDANAELIVSAGEMLSLPTEGVWVDVDAFQHVSEFSSSELTLVATATDAHAGVVGCGRRGA